MDALQGRRKRRNTVTDSPPLKRRRTTLISERSPLEALPLDLMVKVFCGVEYRDLKQIFHVSKAIRVAVHSDC
ncbi:hypothetical protein RIF29_15328 [Crotalaria pallida]|uniref:F-box domain-containing protein n=1 Tax=Crotalaria pallida TaxID=3830 RepID=A0AAN9FH24_CROPI